MYYPAVVGQDPEYVVSMTAMQVNLLLSQVSDGVVLTVPAIRLKWLDFTIPLNSESG